jgi:hypothetical protein
VALAATARLWTRVAHINIYRLFDCLGQQARQLIEKYFNTATVVVIILLTAVIYMMRKLGHIFAG